MAPEGIILRIANGVGNQLSFENLAGTVKNVEVKIGCCGFPVGRTKYFQSFNLVEIQETFYKLPRPKTSMRWREESPSDFEFSVKCWQAVTHPSTSPTWRRAGISVEAAKSDRYGLLRPTKENLEAWDRTREICKSVNSRICVVQCPPQFSYTTENVNNVRRFFKSIARNGLRIAWEPRGDWKDHKEEIANLCRELELIHVVDILRRYPAIVTETVYTRLHGLGRREYDYKYKYTENDLELLLKKVVALEKRKVREVYVLFNNVHMLEDAKRLRQMLQER